MNEICQSLFDQAKQVEFVDPLTGLPPQDEASLSTLLCLFHQANCISWNQVPLLLPLRGGRESSGRAADFILAPGSHICSEYPLFWGTKEENEARGSMRPDLLVLSIDYRRATFIENKVGAPLTHKGDAFGGQLGRYLKYLVDSSFKEVSFVLLTSRSYISREHPWYLEELETAHKIYCAQKQVAVFVITWESILEAVSPLTKPNPSERD